MSFGLYVHIPYCIHKCPYCDFNTYVEKEIPEKAYINALIAELKHRATLPEWQGRELHSIYFGGGTPSIFKISSLKALLETVEELFEVAEQAEITLEANPGKLTSHYLNDLLTLGVNRLSLGMQSLDHTTLKTLGRQHTPEQVHNSVDTARNAGFKNLNLDLIFGVPEQSTSNLLQDLKNLVSLNPEHISAYTLTIEKGTPFYQQYRRGTLKPPDEGLMVEMMDVVKEQLEAHGYERYEISNYAKPSFYAIHNLAYWKCRDYLGLGAGAHSFCSRLKDGPDSHGTRWSNYATPSSYMKMVGQSGQAVAWQEKLYAENAIFEFFFLGLRRLAGVSLDEFARRFGHPIEKFFGNLVNSLVNDRFLRITEGRLHLTEKGLLMADSVIERFSEIERPELLSANG